MRFTVTIQLNQSEIPKDRSRIFLSLIKFWLEKENPELFHKLYGSKATIRKDFTYSLFLGDCKFKREIIEIPDKQAFLNLSSYDLGLGIHIYNALLKGKGHIYSYKDLSMCIRDIQLQKEKLISTDLAFFQTMSPCVVREHHEKTNRDWFYSLSEEKGRKLFLQNVQIQVVETLPEAKEDVQEMKIKVFKNKEVKVKHYGIEVLANICELEIKAKPYILDYLYKAGIGSLKSTGFGMLKVR